MPTTPVGGGGDTSTPGGTTNSSWGSGGKWLAKFLYDHGLRGNRLAYAWSLAMRESGGRPVGAASNTNDFGLFQINSVAHADKLRAHGWSTTDIMNDPEKNLTLFLEISKNGKIYEAWGIPNADGSVTGWAAHVRDTQPSNWARFNAAFDSNMRQWGERYAGRYGGTSSATGSASAATGQSQIMGEAESLAQTNSAEWATNHSSTSAINWALNEVNSAQDSYSGLCDHFVGLAYGFPHSGFDNASQHWYQSPGKHKDGVPPVGTLVFWTGGKNGDGHVAISLGGGLVASTDILRQGKVDVVSIDYINSRWGNLNYQGWANPYFYGQRFKPAGTDAELNARINYAANASNARSSGNSNRGATVPDATGGDTGGGDSSSSSGDRSSKPEDKPADVNNDGKVDKLDYAQMAKDYGLAWSFLKSDPELMQIVKLAVRQEWDETRFENALHNTKWWRTHEATWRQTEALRLTDPASYGSRIKDKADELKAFASQMGVQLSQEQANTFAYRALHYGWTQSDYRRTLSALLEPGATGFYMGQAGDNEEALRNLAYRNGVTMDDEFYKKAVQSIAGGTRTMGDWEDYIRKQAASMFPAFANEIMQGNVDVMDLAAPYRSRMSQILELSDVGLDDPTLRAGLNAVGADGKPSTMGLWDFENKLRNDPRWMTTKNARDRFDSTVVEVLKSFGFMG